MNALFSPSRPLRSLTALFTAWKAILLAVALGASVAPDYDTSTSLFFERLYGANASVPTLAARLTRWDALYFVHSTVKGYVYEQEWAFGLGLPTTLGFLSKALAAAVPANYALEPAALEPAVAIALAHASHFLAVLALHRLTLLLSGSQKLAFVSAALHIFSPAGLFLSAPYNESPFACLCFLGNWLFAAGLDCAAHQQRTRRDAALVAAGVFFGLATAFRSNGLTSGLLFAVEAVSSLRLFASRRSLTQLSTLAAPILGGLCVAAGSVVPQALAWMRYCGSSGLRRPWCDETIPSIYTFVQDHYWYVAIFIFLAGIIRCACRCANEGGSQERRFLEILDAESSAVVPARQPYAGHLDQVWCGISAAAKENNHSPHSGRLECVCASPGRQPGCHRRAGRHHVPRSDHHAHFIGVSRLVLVGGELLAGSEATKAGVSHRSVHGHVCRDPGWSLCFISSACVGLDFGCAAGESRSRWTTMDYERLETCGLELKCHQAAD